MFASLYEPVTIPGPYGTTITTRMDIIELFLLNACALAMFAIIMTKNRTWAINSQRSNQMKFIIWQMNNSSDWKERKYPLMLNS